MIEFAYFCARWGPNLFAYVDQEMKYFEQDECRYGLCFRAVTRYHTPYVPVDPEKLVIFFRRTSF